MSKPRRARAQGRYGCDAWSTSQRRELSGSATHGVAGAVLRELAEPLLESAAFHRLTRITFLGILSPRFAGSGHRDDGTRADHSVEVARGVVDIARRLGLSLGAQRYAAAWGLVHDIATWPLSHTSEPAFVRLTGVDARSLRAMMICGHRALPGAYQVRDALCAMGVDPARLSALFAGRTAHEPLEFRLLSQVIHCRFTPDTLEGMYRTGISCGVHVPPPEVTSRIFQRDLFEVVFGAEDIGVIRDFWDAKSRLYAEHINSPRAVERDSVWSASIERALGCISLAQSLSLTEEDIWRSVGQFAFPLGGATDRYKPPLAYQFSANAAGRIAGRAPVAALDQILLKTRAGEQGDRTRASGHS